MPTLHCPNCRTLVSRIQQTGNYAYVNYYRCQACGHFWTVKKTDPSVVTHVTPLKKKRRTERKRARPKSGR
jgi:hypothetical protein